MDKVDARYISFDSPDDVIKEQERLMSLPLEEMMLEMKRLCLDRNDWECFFDEFKFGREGYGKKANVIVSCDDCLGAMIASRGYATQLPSHKNFQIRSNWEQIKAMLCMRETFSMCALTLLNARGMEDVAIQYNELMGRYIKSHNNDDRIQQEKLIKGFSVDGAFAELRDMANNIKRFYGTDDGEILPEEQVMTLLEQYRTELEAILTGAKPVEEKYTDEYAEIDEEIEFLLNEIIESGEQEIPVLRSPFFNKFEIIRDYEKEKTESKVHREESHATQDTEKSIKSQKLAEFMKTQGLTQSDILELLTTLGREGMIIEAEQQVINIAESERSGKTNENEGVNR